MKEIIVNPEQAARYRGKVDHSTGGAQFCSSAMVLGKTLV